MVAVGNRRTFSSGRLSPRIAAMRFPFHPVPAPQPLPSERGKIARKKLKEEITPMDKVEQSMGVTTVYNTPRKQTPMQANGIKARLAFFEQFEEVVELEC